MMPRHPPRALSSLTYIKAHAQLKYHLPVIQDRRYPVRLLRCSRRPRRLQPERPASRRERFVGGGHPPSSLTQNIGLMFKPTFGLRHQCEGEAIQLRALVQPYTPVSAESCFSVPSVTVFGKPPGHPRTGGAGGIRTPDLRRAKAALSQLSYGPVPPRVRAGGPSWIRTRDLSLIRTAL
jgi:hypothetical protein